MRVGANDKGLHSNSCGLLVFSWRCAEHTLFDLDKFFSIASYGEYNAYILGIDFIPFK